MTHQELPPRLQRIKLLCETVKNRILTHVELPDDPARELSALLLEELASRVSNEEKPTPPPSDYPQVGLGEEK